MCCGSNEYVWARKLGALQTSVEKQLNACSGQVLEDARVIKDEFSDA